MRSEGDLHENTGREDEDKWKINIIYTHISKLRHNTHAIKFTISKCAIQGYLIYPQS